METIRGAFVRFLSAPGKSGSDSGLALVRYESSGQLVEAKVGGPFSPMTQPDEWIVAEGEWRENFFRGRGEMLFRAVAIHPDLPATKAGARHLFSRTFSAADHGVTPDRIDAFLARHGDKAALKAESDAKLLLEMSADPGRFAADIFRDWARRISGRKAVRVLEGSGMAPEAVRAVLRTHRDATMSVIERNPYELAQIPQVGFAEADKLGCKMGIARDDVRRVGAAVSDVIAGEDGSGHTYTPLTAMKDGLEKNGVDLSSVRGLIAAGGGGSLVFDREDGTAVAQKKHLHDCERRLSVALAQLVARGRDEPKAHIDRVSAQVLAKEKYSRFDDIQRGAVLMAARECVSVLTGGPGTGKSTVTEAIAEIAAETAKGPVILMAPTGKAARRLEETTGRPAMTVHKALGATGEGGGARFMKNRSNPLPAGCFVVVDEASMLDVEVAAALLDALPKDGRILFVGDRNQLPSVGPGYVLGDMIAACAPNGNRVPCAELLAVYRTKSKVIAEGAAGIREGTFEAERLDNVMRGGVMMYDLRGGAITERIVHLMTKLIPKSLRLDSMKDVAVLCPQRSGTAGTWEINEALSKALNPTGQAIEGLVHAPGENRRVPLPRVGDRVMLTRNDYDNDVMNGDVGTIVEAFVDSSGPRKEKKVRVRFDSGQVVAFPLSRCRDLTLAYAITGHKSQGSQYPCVIMPVSSDHSGMLDRTLVYTEWTRAKDFLILVGEPEVLSAAVRRTDSGQRRTRLKRFLEITLGQIPAERAALASPPAARPPAARPLRVSPPAPVRAGEAREAPSRTAAQPSVTPRFRLPRPPVARPQGEEEEQAPAPRP